MALPEPLRRQLQTVRLTDDEIRRICRDAADEAERITSKLKPTSIRRAQIELAKANAQMWGSVLDATKVGIGDAVDSASTYQALFDERLFANAGIPQRYWYQSMLATGRVGIDSIISRKENGITLSERVYQNQAVSKGEISKIVNSGLLLGQSPREIAKAVRGFVDPTTPGGASYAAMRLGRSEVLNAYHQTSVRRYQEEPWIEKVVWNLSGSHPRPDECNEYADSVHETGKGWEAGQYKPANVPAKPHPNCLCYVTPVVESIDDFVKNFHDGRYDSYLDNQMGCSRVA